MDNTLKGNSKIMEMAEQVGNTLVEGFSGIEQYQFFNEVEKIIEADYIQRINEAEQLLKSIHGSYGQYKGDDKMLKEKRPDTATSY